MAQKVEVTYVSDLSGDEGAETIQFGLDGTTYEIDLTSKEATAFRKALGKYVEHGQKITTGRRGGRRGAATTRTGPDTKLVREWARSQGMSVPDRGRIPNDIQAKYEAAHPS